VIKQMPEAQNAAEKRRFERVDISHEAQVLVLDAKGHKAGVLRQLARGGFMMEPEKDYSKDNRIYNFTIHDPREGMSVTVNARPRFCSENSAGFEFVDLDPHAAVEIGLIIGAYYDEKQS
jgi:PilZ domain